MTATTPKATDPFLALVRKWRCQADGQTAEDHAGSAFDEAADDLRGVIDSFGDPVESTEYRVTTTRRDGRTTTFDAADFQAQFWLNNHGRNGYPSAVVECRTVTTITTRSGWRPVPDDTEGETRGA